MKVWAMQRLIKQASIFFGLLLVVTIARLPYGSYTTTILQRIRPGLAAQKISIDIEAADLSFPLNLAIKRLALVLPAGKIPVPLVIDSLGFNLKLWSLLLLNADVSFDGTLYGGQATGIFNRPLFGGPSSGEVKLESLHLNDHPVLKSLGVSGLTNISGRLNTRGDLRSFKDLESANLKLYILEGAFESTSSFLPVGALPPLREINGSADVNLREQRVSVERLKFRTSLGSVEGSGTFEISTLGALVGGGGKLRIQLNDLGKSSIGGYLALAARTSVDNPAANWAVDIGVENNGRLKAGVRPE